MSVPSFVMIPNADWTREQRRKALRAGLEEKAKQACIETRLRFTKRRRPFWLEEMEGMLQELQDLQEQDDAPLFPELEMAGL